MVVGGGGTKMRKWIHSGIHRSTGIHAGRKVHNILPKEREKGG